MAKCEKCGAEYPDGTEHTCEEKAAPAEEKAPEAPAEAPTEAPTEEKTE